MKVRQVYQTNGLEYTSEVRKLKFLLAMSWLVIIALFVALIYIR